MLALFDKNIKHPEILPRYKNLFVEKLQCPLALTPSAEDDQVAARMWPMRSSPGLSVRGGRGGIMDRGRGRGRGAYHSVGSGGGFSSRPGLFPEEEGGGRVMGRVSITYSTSIEPQDNQLLSCYSRESAGRREMERIRVSGPQVCPRPVPGRSITRTAGARALRVGVDHAATMNRSSSGAVVR